MPSSLTTSPTENACGGKSGSKKKDPRIVLSALDGHENSAAMCTSRPDNTCEYARQHRCDNQLSRTCRCRITPHFNDDYHRESGKVLLSTLNEWSAQEQ